MNVIAICPAKSTTGCAAATVDGDDLECLTFTAKLRDTLKPISPVTTTNLIATDRTVTVVHDDPVTAMTTGQNLILGQHADGYWFVLKWVC